MNRSVGSHVIQNKRHEYSSKNNWSCDTPLVHWLKSFNTCSLAVTITFGSGRAYRASSPSRHSVEEILRKCIKRLNTLCYRNLVKRKGFSIGAVTAIEGDEPFLRIHAHIGFEPPPGMPLNHFRGLVARVFKPSKWIEYRPHMVECWSQDWINYVLKLGQEAFVPSCCLKAKHTCA